MVLEIPTGRCMREAISDSSHDRTTKRGFDYVKHCNLTYYSELVASGLGKIVIKLCLFAHFGPGCNCMGYML